MYCYSAYGLILASDLLLPELQPGFGRPDVHIRVIESKSDSGSEDSPIECISATPERVRLSWGPVADLLIEDGCLISVTPGPAADEESLRLFIGGAGIGVLLHQRGLLVLHGSAVVIRGQAIGFVGAKGWGKSTTATALHRRGHALVTDELLVVDLDENRGPTVRPGSPYLKLWHDALLKTGGSPESARQVLPGADKYYVGASVVAPPDVPLRRIYVLDAGERLAAEPIHAAKAFFGVVPHLYVSRFGTPFLQSAGSQPAFSRLAAVLRKIETIRLMRCKDLAQLPDIASLIESDCSDVSALHSCPDTTFA